MRYLKEQTSRACWGVTLTATLMLGFGTVGAQEKPARMDERVSQLAELFGPAPVGYENVFSTRFLSQVRPDQLTGLFTGYFRAHGAPVSHEAVGPLRNSWIYRLTFSDGAVVVASLTLDAAAPNLMAGMLLGSPWLAAPPPEETYVTRTSLRLPFDGEWYVFWGGRTLNENYHRASVDQRFAYDFVVRENHSTSRGGTGSNDYFLCFGKEILAPGTGTVVTASDGVEDNLPGVMNPRQPMGNYVIIDHGNGEFSFLAHFKNGSIRVREDETVSSGDVLGQCGNSGNSSEAHLHYHLQNTPQFAVGRGLPAQFVDFTADGSSIELGEPARGQTIRQY